MENFIKVRMVNIKHSLTQLLSTVITEDTDQSDVELAQEISQVASKICLYVETNLKGIDYHAVPDEEFHDPILSDWSV